MIQDELRIAARPKPNPKPLPWPRPQGDGSSDVGRVYDQNQNQLDVFQAG